MKMKKILLTVMCLAFAVSSLSGCDGKGEQKGDYETTLRIEIFDRGDVPAGGGSITDNAMTKWAQENFGDKNNIKLEYVSVPRTQETQQLNVLMAAKEAPDIIFAYSYADMYNFYKLGQIDGRQYLIPAKRVVRGALSQMIRQDWLDELGMKAPTTTDELYEVLKAFKEKDPDNVGDKLVPYALSGPTYTQYRDLLMSFVDRESMDEATRLGSLDHLMPGFEDGLRFMNKLYNEGLLSMDFALDKDRKQMESDIANGYVGFFNDDLGRPLQVGAVYETLKKTVPGAKLSAVDTFSDKNGKHPKWVYSANGLYIGIPVFSKNAEAAIKYLNWMSEEDNLFTLQYGIEGRNYTLDENGFPEIIETEEASKTHWYNLGFDMALIVNGKYIRDDELSIEYNAMATGENKELYMQCYENSVRDGWSTPSIPSTLAESKYSSNYYEKANELCNRCIMAKPEEFDSVYNDIITQMHNLGGDEMVKERIEAYREFLK